MSVTCGQSEKKLKPRSSLPLTKNPTHKPPQLSSISYIPAEALRTIIAYADIAGRNTSQSRARATVQAEVIPTSDNSLNKKCMDLENSIWAINTRIDKLFKLIQPRTVFDLESLRIKFIRIIK